MIRHITLTMAALVVTCGLSWGAPPRMSPYVPATGLGLTFTSPRPVTTNSIVSGGYVVPNGSRGMPGSDPRTWSPTDVPGRDPRTWSPYPYRPYPNPPVDYWLMNPYWRNQYQPYAPLYPDYFDSRINVNN